MRVPRHAEVWTVAALAGLAAFGWVLVRGDSTADRRDYGGQPARVDRRPSDPDDLERWLQRNPSSGGGWLDLGNKRFSQGRVADARSAWTKAETIYEGHAARGFSTGINVPRGWYNFARVRARLGKAEEALGALERAVAAGWHNADQAIAEADLEPIKSDPRFDALIDSMRSSDRPVTVTDP